MVFFLTFVLFSFFDHFKNCSLISRHILVLKVTILILYIQRDIHFETSLKSILYEKP